MGIWVAAMDGGGTKTAAALADRDGAVLARPFAPGCNPQDGPGWDPTLRAVLDDLAAAPGGLAAATLGLPGLSEVPAHDAAVLALVASRLACPWEPHNDVALAHLGAFAGGEGVLVLSGTGSMAIARGPVGTLRVGGWGDVLGDEGSAAWIGQRALALAARALDGRAPEAAPFAAALLGRLGPEVTGAFAPLAWLMAQPGTPRAAAAAAARVVDALAQEEGWPEALALLHEAAAELALAARTAATRAGLKPGHSWVASGGAFRSALLRGAVAAALGRSPDPPRLSPLAGGLRRAAERAGWAPDEPWSARVEAGLAAQARSRVTTVPP